MGIAQRNAQVHEHYDFTPTLCINYTNNNKITELQASYTVE